MIAALLTWTILNGLIHDSPCVAVGSSRTFLASGYVMLAKVKPDPNNGPE
jgi:hypothetical protein